jgi:hypothetical protein
MKKEASKGRKKTERLRNRKVNKRKKNRYYGKADIYVVRVRHDGSVGNSRPCQECVNAMRCAGVRRVYYTMDDQTLRMEYIKDMESDHLSPFQETHIETGFKLWYF